MIPNSSCSIRGKPSQPRTTGSPSSFQCIPGLQNTAISHARLTCLAAVQREFQEESRWNKAEWFAATPFVTNKPANSPLHRLSGLASMPPSIPILSARQINHITSKQEMHSSSMKQKQLFPLHRVSGLLESSSSIMSCMPGSLATENQQSTDSKQSQNTCSA